MKDRGTFVLLILFFAGLIGLWVADFAQVPTRLQRDRMSNRVLPELVDVKPDDLLKVEILGGDEPIVFERREGNHWQMTSPLNAAADPSKVETLAYNLKELSRRPDAATIEGERSQFGLTPPERTVKLWGKATEAPLASIEVGRISLDRRYVRAVGSEGVEVVEAKALDLLRLPAIRWRDAELFRVPSFEVDTLNISNESKTLKLRRGRGSWHLVEPVRLLAAEAKVEGLIADLGSLRVLDDSRFVANDVKPADLDRFGLKTPSLTIELDSVRGDRRRGSQVLHIGKPVEGKEDQVYAQRGDQDDVVIVDRRILKTLKPEPNAFRSPKVADIIPARVIRIGVEDGDGTSIEAVRAGNEWIIAAPTLAKADRPAIQDFLKALDQLETSTYLGPESEKDSELSTPSLNIKVWQAADPRDPSSSASTDSKGYLALDLRIGRRDLARKSIYARIGGDSTILALPDTANNFLPRNPLAFQDRQVLGLDVDLIEQVQFAGTGRTATINAPIFKFKNQNQALGLAPPGWWMVEPINAPADAPSVGKLLRLLTNLRAENLLTEKPESLEKYGLATPALTVSWSGLPPFSMVEKPTPIKKSTGSIPLERHSLLIGAPLADRPNVRYAKLSDGPLVFTLGPDAIGVLDGEWRDHRVMTFDPARVRKIQLDWAERGLGLTSEFVNSTNIWHLDADQDAPDFDPGSISTIVQAASKLATPRYFQQVGDFPAGTGLAPARLKIRFDLNDGTPQRTLKLGASAMRGLVFATIETGEKGAVFIIPEAPFAPLFKAPRHRDDLPDNVFAP